MKKGVELTMSTIIIVALLLILLVVILAIFQDKIGDSIKDLDDARDGMTCDKAGCKPFTGSCPDGYRQCVGNFKEHKEGKVCCQSQ
jgi:hypothetical protein